MSTWDRLEGTVLINQPPMEFAGTVVNLNDSPFRTGYEAFAGPQAQIFPSTWGLPEVTVSGSERRVRNLLGRLFAPAAARRS
jgi:hypothetical protein